MEAEALVRAAIADDQRAWTKLYGLVETDLRRYFSRRFGPEDIDDLVQATLVAVFSKLRKFEDRGESSFLRWVYGFASNEARMAMRERMRRNHRLAELEGDPKRPRTSPSSKLDRKRRMELIRAEAAELRSLYRRAIENELAGGDAGTFAAQEQLGRNAARVVRGRAFKQIRARLGAKRPATRSPSTPPAG